MAVKFFLHNTLGIELLSAAFVRQAAVRPQVLDAASMALAIRAPSTDNFILLLGKICQQTPSLVLPSFSSDTSSFS